VRVGGWMLPRGSAPRLGGRHGMSGAGRRGGWWGLPDRWGWSWGGRLLHCGRHVNRLRLRIRLQLRRGVWSGIHVGQRAGGSGRPERRRRQQRDQRARQRTPARCLLESPRDPDGAFQFVPPLRRRGPSARTVCPSGHRVNRCKRACSRKSDRGRTRTGRYPPKDHPVQHRANAPATPAQPAS
jgi:hypothetical protein